MGITQGRPCAPEACWRGQAPSALYPQALLEVPELRMKKHLTGPQEVTEEWIFLCFLEIDSQPRFSLPLVRWGEANGFCHWFCVFLIIPEGSPTLVPKFGVSYRLGTGWKAVLSNFFSISKALQRSVGNKGKKREAFRTLGPGL